MQAYGRFTIPVISYVIMAVKRGNIECELNCKLVRGEYIQPILGCKVCIGMRVIKILDNDEINTVIINH